jgi:hypothetical protein
MGGPGGPDGPMGPMGPDLGPPVMNGMNSGGDGLDGMKNSPANGPGTPREDGPPMGYDIPGYGGENVSVFGFDLKAFKSIFYAFNGKYGIISIV